MSDNPSRGHTLWSEYFQDEAESDLALTCLGALRDEQSIRQSGKFLDHKKYPLQRFLQESVAQAPSTLKYQLCRDFFLEVAVPPTISEVPGDTPEKLRQFANLTNRIYRQILSVRDLSTRCPSSSLADLLKKASRVVARESSADASTKPSAGDCVKPADQAAAVTDTVEMKVGMLEAILRKHPVGDYHRIPPPRTVITNELRFRNTLARDHLLSGLKELTSSTALSKISVFIGSEQRLLVEKDQDRIVVSVHSDIVSGGRQRNRIMTEQQARIVHSTPRALDQLPQTPGMLVRWLGNIALGLEPWCRALLWLALWRRQPPPEVLDDLLKGQKGHSFFISVDRLRSPPEQYKQLRLFNPVAARDAVVRGWFNADKATRSAMKLRLATIYSNGVAEGFLFDAVHDYLDRRSLLSPEEIQLWRGNLSSAAATHLTYRTILSDHLQPRITAAATALADEIGRGLFLTDWCAFGPASDVNPRSYTLGSSKGVSKMLRERLSSELHAARQSIKGLDPVQRVVGLYNLNLIEWRLAVAELHGVRPPVEATARVKKTRYAQSRKRPLFLGIFRWADEKTYLHVHDKSSRQAETVRIIDLCDERVLRIMSRLCRDTKALQDFGFSSLGLWPQKLVSLTYWQVPEPIFLKDGQVTHVEWHAVTSQLEQLFSHPLKTAGLLLSQNFFRHAFAQSDGPGLCTELMNVRLGHAPSSAPGLAGLLSSASRTGVH